MSCRTNQTCAHCGGPLAGRSVWTGRQRRYCGDVCRQRAARDRKARAGGFRGMTWAEIRARKQAIREAAESFTAKRSGYSVEHWPEFSRIPASWFEERGLPWPGAWLDE